VGLVALCTVVLLALGAAPVEERFSIAWSEYPSWSVFGVAGTTKVSGELIIDGKAGGLGIVEKRWGVDIILKEADYDTCITMYAAGQCDMSCLTNMDVLNPALGRKSVSILPTSTSFGADACIVTSGITGVERLKDKSVYGLAKSVSEYCWGRNLVLRGQKETDYRFTNMDPAAAALAMQQGQRDFDAIMVWNPFVLSTLTSRRDVRMLFDSTEIPGEIIDMVIMSHDSLTRPKGKEAACAVIDAYYVVSARLADPTLQDDMLVALGEKFSHLNAAQMKTVVRQTRFYATPEQGISLFTGGMVFPWSRAVENTSDLFTNKGFQPQRKDVTDKTLQDVMPLVVDFCVVHGIVPEKPTISYGSRDTGAQLRFDPTCMQEVARKR
jgi:NitT/TauT family transport system substrate-binding protein